METIHNFYDGKKNFRARRRLPFADGKQHDLAGGSSRQKGEDNTAATTLVDEVEVIIPGNEVFKRKLGAGGDLN